MFGLLLAGLFGKGAHTAYKDIEFDAKAQAAGHRLLIGCNSSNEVIRTKCIFSDTPDMPRLTDIELSTIEEWYSKNGGVSREIMMGYYKQTGKFLFDAVREKQ
uniref:hypothetical protein n=1 Tax=Clostridium sp. 12(A) TaxID=1163671 RepID=UPI000463C1C8|nr:hypothetical protein [Clostridium sp. 12(A)]